MESIISHSIASAPLSPIFIPFRKVAYIASFSFLIPASFLYIESLPGFLVHNFDLLTTSPSRLSSLRTFIGTWLRVVRSLAASTHFGDPLRDHENYEALSALMPSFIPCKLLSLSVPNRPTPPCDVL